MRDRIGENSIATTGQNDYTGTHGRNSSFILSTVSQHMDRFIDEYPLRKRESRVALFTNEGKSKGSGDPSPRPSPARGEGESVRQRRRRLPHPSPLPQGARGKRKAKTPETPSPRPSPARGEGVKTKPLDSSPTSLIGDPVLIVEECRCSLIR